MVTIGATSTSSTVAPISTSTAIKTLIQLQSSSSDKLTICQWWIEFDGTTAAPPVKVELLRTTTNATVTAYTSSDIVKWSDANAAASSIALSTTASGYNASAEGTFGTVQTLEVHHVMPSSGILVQYPLGREPTVPASTNLRLRVTTATAYNAYAGIVWEE